MITKTDDKALSMQLSHNIYTKNMISFTALFIHKDHNVLQGLSIEIATKPGMTKRLAKQYPYTPRRTLKSAPPPKFDPACLKSENFFSG